MPQNPHRDSDAPEDPDDLLLDSQVDQTQETEWPNSVRATPTRNLDQERYRELSQLGEPAYLIKKVISPLWCGISGTVGICLGMAIILGVQYLDSDKATPEQTVAAKNAEKPEVKKPVSKALPPEPNAEPQVKPQSSSPDKLVSTTSRQSTPSASQEASPPAPKQPELKTVGADHTATVKGGELVITAKDGSVVRTFPVKGEPSKVTFSKDDEFVSYVPKGGKSVIWDMKTGQEVQ